MNSEEARLLLQAASLGTLEPDNADLTEALEQARRDPELFAWFQNQQVFDSAMAQRLQQLPVPADLADRIVTGLKHRSRAKRRRHALSMALAAGLVALFTIGALLSGFFRSPTTEFTELRTDLAELLMTFPALELATDQWPRMEAWLNNQPGFATARLPAEFQKYPGLGCRGLQWRGQRLLLVCFAAQGQVVHLVVLLGGELPGAPEDAQPMLSRVKGWSTAGWTRDGIVFLALTRGDQGFLRGLLRELPG